MTEPRATEIQQGSNLHLPVLDRMQLQNREVTASADELVEETKAFIESFKAPETRPDVVFFLLKSATPVARMFKTLWPTFYPDIPVPAVRYVNIGRKDKSEYVSSFNLNTFEEKIDYIPPDIGASPVEKIKEVFGESFGQGKKILIVDEWSESGSTIAAAKEVFEKAYPEAKIATRVVYKKRLHWYDVPSYLGIEDASIWSNEAEALHRVNKKYRTNFESEQDMMGDPRVVELRKAYNTFYATLAESPFGVTKPENFDKNLFELAKREQEIICEEVIKRAGLHKDTP